MELVGLQPAGGSERYAIPSGAGQAERLAVRRRIPAVYAADIGQKPGGKAAPTFMLSIGGIHARKQEKR